MRFEGRIKQWNDERGFGFIVPTTGEEQVFVHISAFAAADRTAGSRPQLGERVSFEIETDTNGRKQARRVTRPDAPVVPAAKRSAKNPSANGYRRRNDSYRSSGFGGLRRLLVRLAAVALVSLMGWQAYHWWAAYGQRTASPLAPASVPLFDFGFDGRTTAPQPKVLEENTNFRCDGRRYCSQMTSCSEATYFLRNCPGTQMDGNGDGVPCESQWCTSPFAK